MNACGRANVCTGGSASVGGVIDGGGEWGSGSNATTNMIARRTKGECAKGRIQLTIQLAIQLMIRLAIQLMIRLAIQLTTGRRTKGKGASGARIEMAVHQSTLGAR